MAKVDKELVKNIYCFLVRKAMDRQITNYEEIAIKFNLSGADISIGEILSPILGHIFVFCKRRGQPHLTSLVVRKSGQCVGIPGRGFWQLAINDTWMQDDIDSNHRVCRHDKDLLTEAYHKQVFDYWKI